MLLVIGHLFTNPLVILGMKILRMVALNIAYSISYVRVAGMGYGLSFDLRVPLVIPLGKKVPARRHQTPYLVLSRATNLANIMPDHCWAILRRGLN
jgi:hypothetical protein